MSTWHPVELPCACGHREPVRVCRGLHLDRLPQLETALLAGELHRFRCGACGRRLIYEADDVCTDFSRKWFVSVCLPWRRDWKAARDAHLARFDRAFTFGPPVAEELGQSMLTRVVWGLEGLREKLLLWRGGFDDRVVEAMKAEIQPEDESWRVVELLSEAHLLIQRRARWTGPEEPEIRGVHILGADAYREAQRRKLSWRGDDQLVDAGWRQHLGPAILTG